MLSNFSDIEAHTQGREVILAVNGDVGAALRKACEHNADGDAVHLARAATIVRRDMLSKKMEFNGSFFSLLNLWTVFLILACVYRMTVY